MQLPVKMQVKVTTYDIWGYSFQVLTKLFDSKISIITSMMAVHAEEMPYTSLTWGRCRALKVRKWIILTPSFFLNKLNDSENLNSEKWTLIYWHYMSCSYSSLQLPYNSE